MAKLQPLIGESIERECGRRGLIKLKHQYYASFNNTYDAIYSFNLATYKGCRVVDVTLGICHKEEERLIINFMTEQMAKPYKKRWYRWTTDYMPLARLMDPDERKDYGFGFIYYDKYPNLIEETTLKMFELTDKYAMTYFKKMADVDVIIDNILHGKGHVIHNKIRDIPFLYLISGRREKAVAYIEDKLRDMPYMEDWLKDFCHKFLEYDYDADPDKLPVE